MLVAALKKLHATYQRGGFRIGVVSLDGEFASAAERIRDEAKMDVNPVSAGEHVPVIERHIRHLKDGVRGMYQVLPFDKKRKLPARIIVELVHAKTFYKNAVPALDGVSDTISPREIVTQQRIHFDRHCCIVFGQYVQTHEEHDNSMKSRTIGAIAMRPTGARQGGYFFFSLESGRLISRNHWTECVMPKEVIGRVHRLARRGDLVGVEFSDRTGQRMETDSDREPSDTSLESEHDDSNDESEESEHDGTATADDDQSEDEGAARVHDRDESDGNDNDATDDAKDPQADHRPHSARRQTASGTNLRHHAAETTGQQAQQKQEMETRYGPRTTAYNLRGRKAPRYDIRTLLMSGDMKGIRRVMTEQERRSAAVIAPRFNEDALPNGDSKTKCFNDVALTHTQFGMNEGLRRFGEKGTEAVRRELQQVHDRRVLVPREPRELNCEERKRALKYLMFLKRKQDGTVKGRGCADGANNDSRSTRTRPRRRPYQPRG